MQRQNVSRVLDTVSQWGWLEFQHTPAVSSGSHIEKSRNRAHSTQCTLFFCPCTPAPELTNVSVEMAGQSGSRSRSSSRRLVRNNASGDGPTKLGVATMGTVMGLSLRAWLCARRLVAEAVERGLLPRLAVMRVDRIRLICTAAAIAASSGCLFVCYGVR